MHSRFPQRIIFKCVIDDTSIDMRNMLLTDYDVSVYSNPLPVPCKPKCCSGLSCGQAEKSKNIRTFWLYGRKCIGTENIFDDALPRAIEMRMLVGNLGGFSARHRGLNFVLPITHLATSQCMLELQYSYLKETLTQLFRSIYDPK